MFDRGPIPRRELWRGWLVLHRRIDFYVSIVVIPLLGVAAALSALFRFIDRPLAWQIVAATGIGFLFGLFVFFELIRGGLNTLRTGKILSSFDDVLTERLHLRPIVSEDGPLLPRVYDQSALEANGLPTDTPKRAQMNLAAGYWWDASQTLTIADRTTGEVQGFASLNGVTKDGIPEAGLSLGPWARGRGLAGEAVGALGQAVAGGRLRPAPNGDPVGDGQPAADDRRGR